MSDNATDPNQGSARHAGASSLSGLVSTLAPTLVVAGIYFIIFLILRKSQRRYYAPRTYLGSLKEDERSPNLPDGIFNWIGAFWKIPDTYALKHQSLDAYLFLRFLRIACAICIGGVVLTWPVLLPLNITGGNNKSQLERLSFSNINTKDSNQRNKLYGHAIVGWIFYGFVLYMVMRELIFYINLRQASLLSPVYSCRMSARTVLFTSVPKPYLDEGRLRKLFGDSVKRIWITGDTKGLDEIVEERDKVAMKLEKAEIKLIKLANKERQKAISHGANGDNPDSPVDPESGDIAARWIPNKKRPAHRTGPLGLFGKKVDTIEWCREELKRLIPDAEREQQRYRKGDYKKIAAVFIEFNNQSAAQAAYQILTHHHALHMAPRYIGIQPGEIVWSSLRIPWWQKVVRRYLVIGFITVMILFWAIPVTFVGIISNVGYLTTISWLSWLNKIPKVIMGVVSGLLPSIMMSILMSLVPVVMRLCAKLAGEPSLSRVELFTQNAYFAFQVIQVFLITTVASSAIAVAKKIVDDPTNTPAILAENLPTASNFYISYFLVQGLTIGVSVLAQVAGFVIFNLVYKFFTSTPRALYNKWANLSAISWGSTMPVYSLISVISITYAGIAPLVSAFGALGIALFYLAYRYNILFVTDTQIDTQGLLYPRAIKQLMTGVYLAEICMIGLFSSSKAPGPAIMMLVFLIFTILFQVTLFSSLNPLLYNLPQSLQVTEESLNTAAADLEAVAPGSGTMADLDNGAEDLAHSTSAVKNAPESSAVEAQPEGKTPNFLIKWLKPWKYANYAILRKVVPRDGPTDINAIYPPEVANDAYYPPNVSLTPPLLWIPEDLAGVSKQEVARTGKVIPITDEGCTLNENGKLEWDAETARPPVWEEKILY